MFEIDRTFERMLRARETLVGRFAVLLSAGLACLAAAVVFFHVVFVAGAWLGWFVTSFAGYVQTALAPLMPPDTF